jgi:hypothetical protein
VIISLLLMCLLIFPLFGETETELSGFAETLVAYQAGDSGEIMAAKTRLRPEFEVFAGDFYLRTTLNAEYNDRTPSKTAVSINEVYVDYAGSCFDLRAGRQIIVWGRADGVQITDIISPKDQTEIIGLEYEDTRLPVNALKARLFGTVYTLETIWIPFYSADDYPENSDNPLTELLYPRKVNFGSGAEKVSYLIEEGNLPDSISDSEIGLRGSLYLPVADISVSLFKGWDNSPAYNMERDSSGGENIITLTPDYTRIWMAGIDAAIPLGSFVLRTEGAWISGRSFSRENSFESPVDADQIKVLAGIDWNPGDGWSLTGQYIEDIIPDYDNKLAREQRSNSITLSISRKLFRETLELSVSSAAGLEHIDSYSSIEVEYAFSDAFHLTLGGVFFCEGLKGKGDYGMYDEFSSIWSRGRFSF